MRLITDKPGIFWTRCVIVVAMALMVSLTNSWLTSAAGIPDPTFGVGGKVTTLDFAGPALAITIQTDGKIVAVGGSSGPMAVARYNIDGSLDSSFDTDGEVTISIPGGNVDGSAVAVEATTGKIVAAGQRFNDSTGTHFVVVRLLGNGTLDNTFDGDGILDVTIPDTGALPGSIAIQSDGKILVGATRAPQVNPIPTVMRFNTNGTVDTGFATSGTINVPLIAILKTVLLQNDKILVGGLSFIRRYDMNGILDPSFGTAGSIPNGTGPNALLSDGKIIGFLRTTNPSMAFVRRYNSDGSVDSGFGSSVSVFDSATAVAVRQNGEVIVVSSGYGQNYQSIVRYSPTGTQLADSNVSYVTDVEVQTDGKIVTAGAAVATGNGAGFGLTRYLNIIIDGKVADFDGDGKADFSVFRPSSGTWFVRNSSSTNTTSAQFGIATDRIVPGDYDGDGKTDFAVFRDGTWYLLGSFNSTLSTVQWGQSGDLPVTADYDQDGRTDIAVYRDGNWYILRSIDGTVRTSFWGTSGDKPVPADYDGTGSINLAVFRPSNGIWYIQYDRLSDGYFTLYFGVSGDQPVPADFDGDGGTDLAVYRPTTGVWYFRNLSSTSPLRSQQFGISTDKAVPADYDGDGRPDVAVFRDGTWYVLESLNGLTAVQWGTSGDDPVPGAYFQH